MNKYDAALKRAAVAYKDEDRHLKATLERIFPELAESEGERIKKRIIQALHGDVLEMDETAECIAWLEKHDEQKFVPEFKVNDWVVHDMSDGRVTPPMQVVELTNKGYVFDNNQCFYFDDAEEEYRKWTFDDARPGDVLISNRIKVIILYCGIKDGNVQFLCDYDFSPAEKFSISNRTHYGSIKDSDDWRPATKKQRELLFLEMKEAGYEFDSENMVLKRIGEEDLSSVDENLLTDAIYLISVLKMENRSDNEVQRAEKCIEYLKSIMK